MSKYTLVLRLWWNGFSISDTQAGAKWVTAVLRRISSITMERTWLFPVFAIIYLCRIYLFYKQVVVPTHRIRCICCINKTQNVNNEFINQLNCSKRNIFRTKGPKDSNKKSINTLFYCLKLNINAEHFTA